MSIDSIFIVSPDHARHATNARPTLTDTAGAVHDYMDELGVGSYFTETIASSFPPLLARMLNATLSSLDNTSTCPHCHAIFRLVSRRRFFTLPKIIIVAVQNVEIDRIIDQRRPLATDPGHVASVPLLYSLYLHNFGELETVQQPAEYRLVSVIHYTTVPRHYSASVRIPLNSPTSSSAEEKWYFCDSATGSATPIVGPDSSIPAVCFFYDLVSAPSDHGSCDAYHSTTDRD